MRNLLDDDGLNGAHEARIVYRPDRTGIAVDVNDMNKFLSTLRYQCQLWAGANAPMIPVESNGAVLPQYEKILPGSAIDGVHGLHPYALFRSGPIKVNLTKEREMFGSQLAVALLEYGKQGEHGDLDVVELEPSDPWRGVYAACLGLLPEKPDPRVLRAGWLVPELEFENYVSVNRATAVGSLEDLIQRIETRGRVSPRRLSMVHLAYGNVGSTSLRLGDPLLPWSKFAQFDAGPNVVVVCSPNNIEDLALLWNLRAAHGDFHTLPIGILSAELSREKIITLASLPSISHNGIPAKAVYVTSASLSVEELTEILGDTANDRHFGIASYETMLTLGAAGGLPRNDILVWQNGVARFVASAPDSRRELFVNRALNETASMHVDVRVLDSPFPEADDIRIDAPNSTFRSGIKASPCQVRSRSEAQNLSWPSRLLMARSVAANRGLNLRESEPGRAGRLALAGMRDLRFVSRLAHAPLLVLLEEMAALHGFGWYKKKLRDEGREADPTDAVAPTADELPERAFSDFKKVLGNSDKATRYWLFWAEKAKLVVKGFQLECSMCLAKQWIPVAGFAPPIICRGCAEEMDTPFGERQSIDFRYRLSERLRRVYEQDAMGHLLVARYIDTIFDGGKTGNLVGVHPGMEVRREGVSDSEGEADVLLLTKMGEFVPVEVKRTSKGFVPGEVAKLEHLAAVLDAPWSIAATCQYGLYVTSEFVALERREDEEEHPRFILSYDALLHPRPFWSINSDPFGWEPLTLEEIEVREREFVDRLKRYADEGAFDWLADSMLSKPSLPERLE